MCDCRPATNQVCQTVSSIAVTQPTCQVLPDNTVNTNPFFNTATNITYWTYKVLFNCSLLSTVIEDVYIPIYENITAEMLTIEERILSCGRFEPITFTEENPPGITPPPEFKFLRINIDGRYNQGSCTIYRLGVLGNNPPNTQTIYVDTTQGLRTFDAGYGVPGIPLVSRLTINKTGEVIINGDQANINYTVTITNTGNTDLTDILFTDTISFDGSNITLGPIVVDPDTITITQPASGMVMFEGNIGDLAMGESTTITESLQMTSFSAPGTFIFNSATAAATPETQDSFDSNVMVPVVSYTTDTSCNVTQNNTVTLDTNIQAIETSPEETIVINSTLTIPETVLLRIMNFDGCQFTFASTGEPVQVNTDLSGTVINIMCNATIPANGLMTFSFPLLIIASNVAPNVDNIVSYSLNQVQLATPNSSVFLGATPLPNTNVFDVAVDESCSNSCLVNVNP